MYVTGSVAKKTKFQNIFYPKSVCVIGVSENGKKGSFGYLFMKGLLEFGYEGKIYPVHPSGQDVLNMQTFTSILDIIGKVDYAVCAVPAPKVPKIVNECVEKKVACVHIFSSGFSEIENETGKKLELEIKSIIKGSDTRVIGPNCMGIYCPQGGLTFALNLPGLPAFPRRTGTLSFLSQSGGNSIYLIREATSRDMYLNKLVSYGNGCDLSEADFLEYFADDPETMIIGAYIEGVKNGLKFKRALKEIAGNKPVIILKAGNTEEGVRAASSHTASIAGSNIVWQSFLKQTGAIEAQSIEELVDIAMLFSFWPEVTGTSVAVIGQGGGSSVQTADEYGRVGLHLPELSREIKNQLNDLYGSEVGRSFRNPVDIEPIMGGNLIKKALKLLVSYDDTDILIFQIAFDITCMVKRTDLISPAVKAILQVEKLTKPTAVVLHSHATPEAKRLADNVNLRLRKAGYPIFMSISRAANAIGKFILYNQYIKNLRNK